MTIVPEVLTKAIFAIQSQVIELGNSIIFRVLNSLSRDTKHILDCFSGVADALSWLEILINKLLDFLDRFEELYRTSQTARTYKANICTVSGYHSFRLCLKRWGQALSSIDNHLCILRYHLASSVFNSKEASISYQCSPWNSIYYTNLAFLTQFDSYFSLISNDHLCSHIITKQLRRE